jgi:hypothetical protein
MRTRMSLDRRRPPRDIDAKLDRQLRGRNHRESRREVGSALRETSRTLAPQARQLR